MGFFNAMSSIGKMNNLLKETEEQLRMISNLIESGAPKFRVQQGVVGLMGLYNQMVDVLQNSSGARVATYTFLGQKTRSVNVLMFLKETIQELDSKYN